jgi:hypothetical protein
MCWVLLLDATGLTKPARPKHRLHYFGVFLILSGEACALFFTTEINIAGVQTPAA